MMNIVIIGAGEIGRYIASLLAKEQHNIILIDKNARKLAEASLTLDVAIREGSGTDWQMLDDLLELSPDLFIALTNSDETNLVACSIAKSLGYPRTIARVRDTRYLNRTRLDFGRIFDVDSFVGPELLVANDILKYMLSPGSITVENFAHGAVQLRTLIIPEKWRKSDKTLKDLHLPSNLIACLIKREVSDPTNSLNTINQIIFPHGNDHILPGDELTIIGETDVITEAHEFFGITQQKIQSVILAGGSLTALNLAKQLQRRDIDIKILEKNYDRCTLLAELLPKCTIVNHDATDLHFLKAEKIGQADLIVACTGHDDTNLLAALLAKEVGCPQAIVVLNNTSYAPLLAHLGINHTVSPRASVANHILSQILSGTVTSLVSLYDNQAEIMEIKVPLDSKIVGIPLSELGPLLPKDFLIAMIQSRGRILIANGTRILLPGDIVIVITHPKYAKELERIF